MRPTSRVGQRSACMAWLMLLTAPATSWTQASRAPADVRAEQEAFLSTAPIVDDPVPSADPRRVRRVTLDDGRRRHDAGVEAADGTDPTRRDYRLNVAAYELDKVLGLDLVIPSVERVVAGRPVSLTWWLDDIAMNELDRRRKNIAPPDPARWDADWHAMRVFDELISNTYRDVSPALYLNTVWDNLLITRDWRIRLTDHTGTFRLRHRLERPEDLARCDRALLRRLRELGRQAFQVALGKYLSAPQLDALEARRALLVTHFDVQIASRGETAVLYSRLPSP